MQVMLNVTYVFESSRRSGVFTPHQMVPVKGDSFVLTTLRQAHQVILNSSRNIPTWVPVAQEIGNWIASLDRKYGEQVIYGGPPYHLDALDGRSLAKDSERWIVEILNAFSEGGTVTITEEGIAKLLSSEFMEKLDPLTRGDLGDGASCVLHLLPTPAVMILLRVAENAVRKYSEKLTGKATDDSWGDILDELQRNARVKKSTLGYLDYLRDMRNEAQHPDKRFTQEEAERILMQVKGLLEQL